ncbi:MAG: LamG-like jellyroll fold domain-containing protein [archaeon]|jgi:prepilin-type N-terminal cleavage/methylation domain-containing protein
MRHRAFTLIELLVVIAIVGILSSVIYTNIQGLRERAKITAGTRFDSSILHSIGDQLVGEWMFDTNVSPTLDTSGFGVTGSLNGSIVWQQTGGYNNKGAYLFDGTNDFIRTGTIAALGVDNMPYTFTAWVKASDGETAGNIIHMSAVLAGTGWCFPTLVLRDSKFVAQSYNGALVVARSTTSVSAGTWYHVASSWDPSGLRVYVNGVLEGRTAQSAYTASDFPNYLHFGFTPNTCVGDTGSYFAGYLDDIRAYSGSLSASEIQELYAEGKSRHEVASN